MKPLFTPYWSLGTILLAGLLAWGVSHLVIKESHHHHESTAENLTLHDWLHENLEIRPEQEELLHPIEAAFTKESHLCQDEIEAAGRDLADMIRNQPENSLDIEKARLRLHEAKGRLEEMTLEHFFAMKQYLDPEQREKLLQWTHDSLIHGHRH
jgi:hypothetical protein